MSEQSNSVCGSSVAAQHSAMHATKKAVELTDSCVALSVDQVNLVTVIQLDALKSNMIVIYPDCTDAGFLFGQVLLTTTTTAVSRAAPLSAAPAQNVPSKGLTALVHPRPIHTGLAGANASKMEPTVVNVNFHSARNIKNYPEICMLVQCELPQGGTEKKHVALGFSLRPC